MESCIFYACDHRLVKVLHIQIPFRVLQLFLWGGKRQVMPAFRCGKRQMEDALPGVAELPVHVLAILLRGLNAGRGIELFQIFRQPADMLPIE